MPRVPAYFDAFLSAIAGGARIDHVHLGHWDQPERMEPAQARATFEQAQARLSDRLIALLNMGRRDRVLDVGSGFGGTLRALRRSHPEAELFGINIDERQLVVSLREDASPTNAVWTAADACRLPFAAATFDRLICVEAAFHFSSRLGFFLEAGRVLRPDGVLVLSDFILDRPKLPPRTVAAFEDRLEADFGPWPTKWTSLDRVRSDAHEAGFAVSWHDATANTLPSYHTIAPARLGDLTGTTVLRELHRSGCLRYLYLRLEKKLP